MALVNESFPSECIRFRSILSPSHVRFRVEGTPTSGHNDAPAPVPAPALANVPVSVESLPLKASRKEQEQTPETSQPPTEEAIPGSPAASEVVVTSSVPEDSPEETRQRDALDELIAEAKATSHLVS